jgi:hypothetical protein
MKRTAIILGIALTLSGSTGNLHAHGGCYGFWPFWPLALGAGIAIASVASAHSSPTYVYVPPAYPYGYTYSYPQPHNSQAPTNDGASAPAATTFEVASRWVPNYPGAGHWVPDPTPYNYAPGAQARIVASSVEPNTQVVMVARSVGDVPVYTVGR